MSSRFSSWRPVIAVVAAFFGAVSIQAQPLELMRVGQIDAADETGTVAYDPASHAILSTNGELKVQLHDFEAGSGLNLVREVDLSSSVSEARFVSGVAADPSSRGFGVATVIPSVNDSIFGKLVFFDTANGEIINSLDVGYNPDNVSFHPDGSRIYVANEAEPGATSDPPGSISVIDVVGLDIAGIGALSNANVSTWDFGAPNLAAGVTLDGIRVDPANLLQPHLDLEPESVVGADDSVYVTLQENNAVAVFDLGTNKWSAIHNLGTIERLIDASDDDNLSSIDDLVHGLPQPDGIAVLQAEGQSYFLTANEGDARSAFEMRFGEHGIEGNPFIDADTLANLSTRYAGADVTDEAILGRLDISTIDGDTDGDNDIDIPTMFGTRSISVWNAETGDLVFDSGPEISQIALDESPDFFNSNGTAGSTDSRSDAKGSEPESIVLGQVGERHFAFVGLERTSGIVMYDVTDPNGVTLVDYAHSAVETGSRSPEGLAFVSGQASVDGNAYLIVGYDRSNSLEVFRIVPEPAGARLMFAVFLGMVLRRRCVRISRI